MNNPIEIKVPNIGDFKEVDVIEVLVSPGDSISPEQTLITLESSKASIEIPAETGGVVHSVKVRVGDRVSEGSIILGLIPSDGPASEELITAPKKTRSVTTDEIELRVPHIAAPEGLRVTEVILSEGNFIEAGQEILTVVSEEISTKIPSKYNGIIKSVKVKPGDTVFVGSVIAIINSEIEPEGIKNITAPKKIPEQGATSTTDKKAIPDRIPYASPSVRKLARELGIDLTQVEGTGIGKRITLEDINTLTRQNPFSDVSKEENLLTKMGSTTPWPKTNFSQFGKIQVRPLSRIKKISGANLHRNWTTIPHVTNNDLADITELESLRATLNKKNKSVEGKITILAFLIKAVVSSLKKFPELNSSLEDGNLILKQYYHIGFAVDTSDGLIVPVIYDVDQKGVLSLSKEIANLAKKAREGRVSPSDMQGGCFTISSLGGIGGTSFTPIINAPEVAVLGVSRSSYQSVWDGNKFNARLMLPLSLSYDHRAVDGATAARFNAHLASLLADFRLTVL